MDVLRTVLFPLNTLPLGNQSVVIKLHLPLMYFNNSPSSLSFSSVLVLHQQSLLAHLLALATISELMVDHDVVFLHNFLFRGL